MVRKSLLVSLLGAGALIAANAATADGNWPAFRGADSMSQVPDDPRLPETWSTTDNVAWKTADPGSRLVVAGDLGQPRLRHHRGLRRRRSRSRRRVSTSAATGPSRPRTSTTSG